MNTEVRQFVVDSLDEMHFDVSAVTDGTLLGDGGLEVESLSVAELALQLEDRYGVVLSDDELHEIPAMTLADLVAFVETRAAAPVGGHVE